MTMRAKRGIPRNPERRNYFLVDASCPSYTTLPDQFCMWQQCEQTVENCLNSRFSRSYTIFRYVCSSTSIYRISWAPTSISRALIRRTDPRRPLTTASRNNSMPKSADVGISYENVFIQKAASNAATKSAIYR